MASAQHDPRQLDVGDYDDAEALARHTLRRMCAGIDVVWICGPEGDSIAHEAAQILASAIAGFDPSVVTAHPDRGSDVSAA